MQQTVLQKEDDVRKALWHITSRITMSRQEAQPHICPKMQRLNVIQYFSQSSVSDKIAESAGDIVTDIKGHVVVSREVELNPSLGPLWLQWQPAHP
jgi:hypothetical protein